MNTKLTFAALLLASLAAFPVFAADEGEFPADEEITIAAEDGDEGMVEGEGDETPDPEPSDEKPAE